MRVWRGAHAGLVAEQTALSPLRQRRDKPEERAAERSGRVERAREDEPECSGQIAGVHDEDNESAKEVDYRHDGHEFLGDAGKTMNVADEDESGDDGDGQADDPAGNARRIVHGFGDGVGLHHAADEAKS